MSRDVRGLRPNRSWKGVIAGSRDEFGMVGLIQQFAATYSFQRVGHALHSSDNTSCIHAPHSSHTTLTPRLIGRVELYPHLSPTTKVFSITAAVTSPPPSALMNEDTPNVRHKSRRRRATSWAPFKERGYAKKNLEMPYLLPAANIRYPLWAYWGCSAYIYVQDLPRLEVPRWRHSNSLAT